MPRNIFEDLSEEEKTMDEKTKGNAEDLIKKYQNYSQSELMAELIKTANEEKQNGNLNKEKLMNIKSTLTPYLNSNQIQFLERIMEKLDV